MRDDEDRQKPPMTHEIGQALDTLSLDERDQRVVMLRREIARLEAARKAKHAALGAADAVFRR